MAIDCTESVRPIKEMKGKEGGIEIIKKLCIISIGVFTRTENNAFTDVVEEGYKLLSRIDVMNNDEHGKVLKQMMAAQRKRYTRNFGGSRIDRFAKSGYDANGGHERRRSGSRSSTMTKIKPGVFSVGCVDGAAFLDFWNMEYHEFIGSADCWWWKWSDFIVLRLIAILGIKFDCVLDTQSH